MVTDDDGATGTVTKSVTVTAAPPANVAPTASFTRLGGRPGALRRRVGVLGHRRHRRRLRLDLR
nr:hypothetical protein [Angustibacter aerolatus]